MVCLKKKSVQMCLMIGNFHFTIQKLKLEHYFIKTMFKTESSTYLTMNLILINTELLRCDDFFLIIIMPLTIGYVLQIIIVFVFLKKKPIILKKMNSILRFKS